MKKNSFLYLFALVCLTLGSCQKDPVPNPDGTFPECIVLTGNQTTDIVLTNHITDPNVPDYCIEGDYDITANLVVEPGVKIQMKNGARIQVIGNGTFNCVGTASERIRIGGESSTLKGQWEVIYIRTNSPENRIEYTDITGGGSHTTYNALVYVDLSGSLSTVESLYAFSASNGLKAGTDDATLGEVSLCDFSLNDLYPISIDAQQIGAIDLNNNGGSNLFDMIEVDDSQLTTPTTIHRSIFPYLIRGQFGINTDVTIEAGADFLFDTDAKMIVWPGGSINCIGTPTYNINFIGLNPTAGSFQGIRFNSSTSPDNRFEYCNFSYGGGSTTYQGMISMWTTSYVRVGNSSFTHSERYGVYNHNHASTFDDDGNNTSSDNGIGYTNP